VTKLKRAEPFTIRRKREGEQEENYLSGKATYVWGRPMSMIGKKENEIDLAQIPPKRREEEWSVKGMVCIREMADSEHLWS